MKVRVLGSAAGGGFPQWNCGCRNCHGLRTGELRAKGRSQESVALSGEGERWFVINASPDLCAQIERFPGLWPRQPRHTPIEGIILTNGDLDHVLGLFSLRESQPLTLYATAPVRRGIQANTIYRTLERFQGQVTWVDLHLGQEVLLPGGLRMIAVASPGKRPIHLENTGEKSPEDNIGLVVRDQGSTLAYFPAAASADQAVRRALAEADTVFFDGTFWSSDELVTAGLVDKRAEEMAHWPVGGAGGSLDFLRQLPARRKILIHLNNTNPLLDEASEAYATVTAAGVELAFDGLELES